MVSYTDQTFVVLYSSVMEGPGLTCMCVIAGCPDWGGSGWV